MMKNLSSLLRKSTAAAALAFISAITFGTLNAQEDLSAKAAEAGTVFDAPVDFDGDHKSDFVVVRYSGSGPTGQITWFVQGNATGAMFSQPWGLSATDYVLSADYDGDGKDDIAVWRRTPTQGTFYIINSGNNTIRVSPFGSGGDDDPLVAGDYDGNGTDDIAVYRPGAVAGADSTWYWRANDSAGISSVVHGRNGDFPAPGDYDGDNKMDYVVQRSSGSSATFLMRFNSGGTQTIPFGNATDLIAPGDYDGDGKTDICTVRPSTGFLQWQFRRSIDGATVTDIWGFSSSDRIVPGDYNGDGKSDYAVWRPGPQATFFIMTPVTRMIMTRDWGLSGDFPVASWNVH